MHLITSGAVSVKDALKEVLLKDQKVPYDDMQNSQCPGSSFGNHKPQNWLESIPVFMHGTARL